MRMIKKICALLLTLICLLSITVIAFADTTYTVRLYPGDPQVGKFSGMAVQERQNRAYGSSVEFDVGAVQIQDSKYAPKGIREAGKDYLNIGNGVNTSYIAASGEVTVPVTRDQDYVVVYGIDGNMVSYTITIVSSTTGAVLRTLQYRGEIGDQPIIALPYIENYVAPGTHGRTGAELSANAANNRWSVAYTPAPTTTGGGTTTVTTGGGGVAAAGNANANANTATANANANSITQNYGPSLDIINDTDVPLAEFEGPAPSVAPVLVPFVDTNGDTAQRRLPTGLTIGLIVVLAGLIAALYWYLLFYRKKKKFANEVDYDFSFLDDDDHDDYR